MASPEVERPRASPSNPVLSPHGLSPRAAGPSAAHLSPGSNTSRKVVTFDQYLDPKRDSDRGTSVKPAGSMGYNKSKLGRHGHVVSGGNQRNSGYHKYRHGTHRSSGSSIKYTIDIENEDKNMLFDRDEEMASKLFPSCETETQSHVSIQSKRFRSGSGIRKRSYSFSEGN